LIRSKRRQTSPWQVPPHRPRAAVTAGRGYGQLAVKRGLQGPGRRRDRGPAEPLQPARRLGGCERSAGLRVWLSKNPALAFTEQAWATGNTVVVSTDVGSRPLACFRFQNGQPGPVTGIPARLPPGNVAVTGDTVYAADASGVIVYRLPVACR
jgi:hypothetical protein